MGIMVNTEDRDGAPWGMRHMVDVTMGHMVNVVMCLIMCNFLNTAWIFTKNLLDIDIDVFYLIYSDIPTMALLSTKIHRFTIVIGSNIFPLLVPTLPMCSYGTCPISLLSVGLSLRFFY